MQEDKEDCGCDEEAIAALIGEYAIEKDLKYIQFDIKKGDEMKQDKDYFLTGIILQKIYDSELHLSIGWMWDGGLDYTIGRDLSYLHNGEVESTGEGDLSKAMQLIADEISEKYPQSDFSEWWLNFKEEK